MNKYICHIFFVLMALTFGACVSEMDAPTAGEGGHLRLSLANISTATTRSTPEQLGRPTAADFRLQIFNVAERAVYDDVFTEEELTLPVGQYRVVVSYGENPLMAVDQPYYEGEATVQVVEDETTEAGITARVGNALVSASFGADEEEHARFERFYSDYALYVMIGTHTLPITREAQAQSIYVQAGSQVSLRFWGKLKMEDDREVSCDLTSEQLSEALNAAVHLMVTLGLPDPESALGVDITKLEVETVTLDETIPLSWLPVPTVEPVHQFDRSGNLVGTNLQFSNGYPGMDWKLEVTRKGATDVLRSEEGQGALLSAYTSSAAWPYLPQGTYVATYYIISDGSAKKSSSREFVVPAPTGLKVSVGGYTSYSKYLEGKIDEANACDRLTVYEPYVSANVANSLLRNSNYTYTFTYTYDGTRYDMEAGSNSLSYEKLEGQPVRSNTYVLRGDLTFDGVSATAQTEFRITGLPVRYAPPSESNGWRAGTDYVTFNSGNVKLGNIGGIATHYNEYITNSDFAIPYNTRISLDYSTMIHPATQGTNLMFSAGDEAITIVEERGGIGNTTDYDRQGSASITVTSEVTEMRCTNSYGGGQSCSYIYSIYYKYAAE